MQARNCQVRSETTLQSDGEPSDCMGNQEILSIFVRCIFCAEHRPRAAKVHGQCKIFQRTTHAMGDVSTKLQFQGGSHQRIRECWSGLS